MKKIKVMRMSGLPVKIENLKAYEAEWKAKYDEIEVRCTIGTNAAGHKNIDRLSQQEKLESLERELKEKYGLIEEWEMLKTKKAWKQKVEEYGHIMVAMSQDYKSLVYVILDQNYIIGG